MKLVILDSYALREGDLDWSGLRALVDEMVEWPRTPYEQAVERIGDAELVVVNKTYIDDPILDACPNLRWIGLTSTGTDNLDAAACRRHGVPVANAPDYSTDAVAQHVFSLLLSICNAPSGTTAPSRAAAGRPIFGRNTASLRSGSWPEKTIGIIGYGHIGRRVARIAQGFGMQVLVNTRTVRPEYASDGVTFLPLDELLSSSDIVTLHCIATDETRGMINDATLAKMKPGAVLINTARGALVEDAAVARALHSGHLGFFGADVVSIEPIRPNNPLLGCDNALLTPHIAWTTAESLARLSAVMTENLRSFLAGKPQNIAN